jgi:glyoxylase-like metal-dependent hydrolase (beta-lactamase superfamily II)
MSITASRQWLGVALVALCVTLPLDAQESGQPGRSGTEIAPGIHLLPDLSCNVLAVTGPQGVLLIDSGSRRETEGVRTVIEELGAGPVRITVDTHFHFDHIGGNGALAGEGAVIVAQENTRARMLAEWRIPDSLGLRMPVVGPYPDVALPTITFGEALNTYFGGQEIALLHFPSAHSDGDLVAFVRDPNVLHTGDLFASGGFVPPMDTYHGGTIDGWIAAVDELIQLTDDRTKVVPGHGPVTDRQALQEFRYILAAGRDRIAELVADGKSLEEVLDADPMADLVGRSNRSFVRTVYAHLAW